jgi:type IV secretory pathway VirB10-like protein
MNDNGVNPRLIVILLSVSLAVGLAGLGAHFFLIEPQRRQERAAHATRVFAEATAVAWQTTSAPTHTPLPTPTPMPTNTPLPTPTPRVTNTPVIRPTDTPGAIPTPAHMPVVGAQLRETGIGGLEAALLVIGLSIIIFGAQRLRLSS